MASNEPVADEPRPTVPDQKAYRTSVGDDPREQSGAVTAAPGKIWFRDLDEAVIEPDRCIQCASCVAACPSDSIGIDSEEGRPTLVRMCTGCSRCWDFCPRSGLRYERIVSLTGEERGLETPRTYAARATSEAGTAGQDGGVVTALLASLLEAGEIDGAIVARERDDEPLRGEAMLATSRQDLLDAAGSTYTQTMGLGQIDDLLTAAALDVDEPSLALVGTPCVIQGAAALERYEQDAVDPIVLTIALMCTRSFEHSRLVSIVAELGVDPIAIESIDVTDGTITAVDVDGDRLFAVPVDEFDAAGLRGCDECTDFVGGAADISAGSIASGAGETTIIVRTDRGKKAWEVTHSADAIEYTELERVGALERIESWNDRRARAILPREYDPSGPVGIPYESHREAYDDTDRAPERLNPARVHQYEEWC